MSNSKASKNQSLTKHSIILPRMCETSNRKCLLAIKARFKHRTLHVPNLMQMSENNRFFSFALDSAHVKFDV